MADLAEAALNGTLKDRLVRQIEAGGPISVEAFMAAALGDPDFGYYMTRDPLGRGGDFITAPEISQMFGELVGLWLASEWQRMGSPNPVKLVELGPGRGTLMTDAIRAMAVMPGLPEAIDLHLVETSPVLLAEQQKRLDASWHPTLAEVAEGPMLLVANEFFDALPIRQFVMSNEGWRERCLGRQGDNLVFVAGELEVDLPVTGEPGDIFETAPAGVAIMEEIATRLRDHDGAALIIDYGHITPGLGDTLQAVRDHKYAEILSQPGEADLTAHVDFSALAKAATEGGVSVHGPVTQGAFLGAMGIEERAERLSRNAKPEQQSDIKSAVARLAGRQAMGGLFKVMALTNSDAPPPPGFGTGS